MITETLKELVEAMRADLPKELSVSSRFGYARACDDVLSALAGIARQSRDADDATGLSVDMLDVDRLREWARLLLVHGADISHWGSVPFVAGKMQTLATELEKAIRDIGRLRAAAGMAAPSLRAQGEKKQQRHDSTCATGGLCWCQHTPECDIRSTRDGWDAECTCDKALPPPSAKG